MNKYVNFFPRNAGGKNRKRKVFLNTAESLGSALLLYFLKNPIQVKNMYDLPEVYPFAIREAIEERHN